MPRRLRRRADGYHRAIRQFGKFHRNQIDAHGAKLVEGGEFVAAIVVAARAGRFAFGFAAFREPSSVPAVSPGGGVAGLNGGGSSKSLFKIADAEGMDVHVRDPSEMDQGRPRYPGRQGRGSRSARARSLRRSGRWGRACPSSNSGPWRRCAARSRRWGGGR